MPPAEYRNSIVLVACYVCVGDKILWIRRGIAPQIDNWAIPGENILPKSQKPGFEVFHRY